MVYAILRLYGTPVNISVDKITLQSNTFTCLECSILTIFDQQV